MRTNMTMNLKLAKRWMVKNKHYILEKLSSLVLWNCAHPSNQAVTKELVNDPDITGKYLHRFSWLKDEEIGAISQEWNWLRDGIKNLMMENLRNSLY